MNKVKKLIVFSLISVMLLLCISSVAVAEKNVDSIDEGYVNVVDFGAIGTDEEDDTDAFEAAIATGKNIYVPKGKFYISRTLKITDRILRGSEAARTVIWGDLSNKTEPIFLVEGVSSISDIRAGYLTNEECVDSKQGEKVVIQLGSADRGVEIGTILENLYLVYCGTAIYNPADAKCNGAIIENLHILQRYRGIDMQGTNRIGNQYSNLYMGFTDVEKSHEVNCGLALEGSSFGETVHQLNVEHNDYTIACAVLKNCKNFNISTIHFEGIHLANDYTGWLYAENSTGYIGAYTTYYSYISELDNSMILMGEGDGTNKIYIGEIHNVGLNQPDTSTHLDWHAELTEKGYTKSMSNGGPATKDFRLFRRNQGSKGEYEVIVDYYSYYSFADNDPPYYLNFVEKDDDLKFTIKHEAKEAAD